MKTQEKHHVYNLIILDESGSMESIKNATIKGFNEVVRSIGQIEKEYKDQKHFVSLVTFNSGGNLGGEGKQQGGIRFVIWNEKVSHLEALSKRTYKPNFSTPLYDAIGMAVTRLHKELPKDVSYNVIVTIITDGMENDSTTYGPREISKLIQRLKKEAWTFAYIGANHDVEAAASEISINSHMSFTANEEDTMSLFKRESGLRLKFARLTSLSLAHDCKAPIQFNEDYFKEEEEGSEAASSSGLPAK